ncbi:hypothetical protein Tco_0676018 [Tanacetum coccineum]
MPVYDTYIEDVIEKEERFARKGGFGGEEDRIKDVVVVVDDLCSSMIQTTLSVDFDFALINLFLAVFAKNLRYSFESMIVGRINPGIRVNQHGDEEEEYPFVDNYQNFQEEENNVSFSGVVSGVEEESMPVYDTYIEDVIEKEERFVGKGGFGGEEDRIQDVVVVVDDLHSSMIQTTLSVDFE